MQARDARLEAESKLRSANDEIHRLQSEVSKLRAEVVVAEQNKLLYAAELEKQHKYEMEGMRAKLSKAEGESRGLKGQLGDAKALMVSTQAGYDAEKAKWKMNETASVSCFASNAHSFVS